MERYQAPFYVMLHPIEGFDELKYHKWGSMKTANLLVIVFFVTFIINRQLSGYSRTIYVKVHELNVPLIFLQTIGLCFIFTVINWAICTLFDGKGRMKDIWISVTYSLTPYVIAMLINTIVSHFLIVSEAGFLNFIQGFGLIYSLFLLIKSIESCHEYTFTSSIVSIVFTVVGIFLLFFLFILLFSVTQQVIAFFSTITQEIALRKG